MTIETDIIARIAAMAKGGSSPTISRIEPRQGPRFTPKALEAYAQTVGEPWPKGCVRCFVVVAHWTTRVFADWREVRFCRDCWREWDARSKARAA